VRRRGTEHVDGVGHVLVADVHWRHEGAVRGNALERAVVEGGAQRVDRALDGRGQEERDPEAAFRHAL
jgi:hypothetical protein